MSTKAIREALDEFAVMAMEHGTRESAQRIRNALDGVEAIERAAEVVANDWEYRGSTPGAWAEWRRSMDTIETIVREKET